MIQLIKIQWSDVVEKFLDKCQGDGWTLDDMRLGVALGSLQLLGVTYYDRLVAAVLLRDENPELVVVAAGGVTIENSTYKTVLPFVKQYAKENGFKTLRAHALDDVRGRALELAGWKLREHIFGIEVA